MPKQVVGRVVKPPEGWIFEEGGMLVPNVPLDATTFDALYAWAKEKNYGLAPDLGSTHTTGGWRVSCRYTVTTDSWDVTEKWLGDGKWQPRQGRTTRVSLGTFEYIAPGGTPYYNMCAYCDRVGLASWYIGTGNHDQRICSECSKKCTTCDNRVSKHANLNGADRCDVCVPRGRCRFCTQSLPIEELLETPEGFVCEPCQEIYRCTGCDTYPYRTVAQRDGTKLCDKCNGEKIEAERIPHEAWEDGELPKGGSLKLASLSNRPVRVMSIETEVDGDATALATTLYNAGLVREAVVEEYRAKCPDTEAWPAFLKYDGSVSGGELINYLIQFDKITHANSVQTVLSKLRSLEKLGKVQYNANCGGHIHIDAHNFSSDNVWRLVTGYNYLEDVIFRLAGAGCSFGHRTLVPGHDAANGGRGYSHPTAKGPWGIKSNAYRACMGQDRMTGLNFQPYRQATEYCACGAGAENLRNCTCVLPKCTIEWRVWNSTGSPRILHGWLAFMQSLHAWADTPKEMTNEEEQQYDPFAWTKLKWTHTTAGHKKVALERVKWIFENLVFSDAERDSVLFAFSKTDIEFPEGFLDDLRALPSPRNRTVTKPRNRTVRTTALAVKRPERKVFGDARRDPAYLAAHRQRRERGRFNEIRRAR